MEAAGIEPASRGSQPVANKQITDSEFDKSVNREHLSGTNCHTLTLTGRLSEQSLAGLALIATQWEALPDHFKQTMMTLVRISVLPTH